MREIPKKNYAIMTIIVLGIIIVTILLAQIYNNSFRKTSIMYNYLSEIKKGDIDTYLTEKPNIILYITDKYDISNDNIEQKIKNKIIKYNIKDYFVFLDLNQQNLNYIEYLNEKYDGTLKNKIPMIIIFEEGKIKNVYYELENINFEQIVEDFK